MIALNLSTDKSPDNRGFERRAKLRVEGTHHARVRGMVVRDFRDLICWQLAHELKCEVFAFTATGPASRDFRYRDDIRDSSASAPANISEGFGRFRPLPFAQFLGYAKAFLNETQDHLIDRKDRGYLDHKLFSRLWNLSKAAERATTNLMLSKLRQARRSRNRQGTQRTAASARD